MRRKGRRPFGLRRDGPPCDVAPRRHISPLSSLPVAPCIAGRRAPSAGSRGILRGALREATGLLLFLEHLLYLQDGQEDGKHYGSDHHPHNEDHNRLYHTCQTLNCSGNLLIVKLRNLLEQVLEGS